MRKEVKDGARDPHLVRDQYEDHWSGVLDHARRIVATEPGSLARVVNLCLAAYAERPGKIRWMRGRLIAAILAGRPLPPRLSPRGIDTISRVAITDLVAGYCNADTKRIIRPLGRMALLRGAAAAAIPRARCPSAQPCARLHQGSNLETG